MDDLGIDDKIIEKWTLIKIDSRLEELISHVRLGMMSSWTDVEDGGSWWFMAEPVAEPRKRSWIDSSPALFSKLLIRRCHLVLLKEKLTFCKIATKALLKPSCELVALVILPVPPVLTVALLNLFLILSRGLSEMEVCVLRWHRLVVWVFQVAAWGRLGASWRWLVYGRPLRPYLILVV